MKKQKATKGTKKGAGGKVQVTGSKPGTSILNLGTAIVRAEEKRVPWSQLSPEHLRMFRTPSGFGRLYLGIPLTEKQAAVCDAFLKNGARVSTVCCNEAGKTTKIMATVILWHIFNFTRAGENGGVTATSGSWAQITNQLMPALHSHRARFPNNWEFSSTEIKVNGSPNFMAYSTVQEGRAEGFHGSFDTPLLMLFDECKSVPDGIIRAAEDRCRPQRLGLLSSPGFAMAKFYESQTSEAAFWTRFKVTVDDCPWIDRKEMRRVIERAGGGDYERGLQDPFIRSAYFAEFMPFVQDSLISLAEIEECLADPPQRKPGERHAFCDFAAGGDENVLAVRHGNRVWIVDAWRDTNTMSACGRFVQNFVKLQGEIGLRAEEIEGDNDGLGNPMVSRLHEVGWPILPFHSNSAAFDPQRFKNRSSETWFEGTEAIQARKVILPDDADLKGQLVDRIGKAESSGKRWIESKKDLFARQARDGRPQRSPDRADAVLGALGKLPTLSTINIGGEAGRERSPWQDDPDIGPGLAEREEGSVPASVLWRC